MENSLKNVPEKQKLDLENYEAIIDGKLAGVETNF